jgi:nicotinamidase-related amidase
MLGNFPRIPKAGDTFNILFEHSMTNLHPQTTALVLIDLQHGNTARDLAPYPASQVVANSARLADAFRTAGATVVYVRVSIGDLVGHVADRALPHPAVIPPNPSEIVPEAGMQPGDFLVTKRQWGAFHATELDQILRRRGVKDIVLAGIATNIGVESTARVAHDLGYDLVFVEDAMSSIGEGAHEWAVEKMFPLMGRVRSTEQLLAALPAA